MFGKYLYKKENNKANMVVDQTKQLDKNQGLSKKPFNFFNVCSNVCVCVCSPNGAGET
eukprot:m.84202 g.84202  ORF g.84202 m.84202 type:complete len:58 (-) comp14379_c0_seq1:1566-1739(-)